MRILALISCFIIAACGFSPVYGTLGKNQEYGQEDLLAYVAIGGIPDREGQFLRNALIDRFYRSGRPANPQYRLSFTPIRESVRDMDITESSDSTRGQLRLNIDMTLLDAITGESLMERNLQSITSFNILRSEFANRVTEQNTRENALNDLARQIERQVILYFEREIE